MSCETKNSKIFVLVSHNGYFRWQVRTNRTVPPAIEKTDDVKHKDTLDKTYAGTEPLPICQKTDLCSMSSANTVAKGNTHPIYTSTWVLKVLIPK